MSFSDFLGVIRAEIQGDGYSFERRVFFMGVKIRFV
jgi:hypothetical protein